MQRTWLYVSFVLFLVALGSIWATQGAGIIHNDPARNIYIPEELTMPMQVKAAYDGTRIWFRYRWPTDRPRIYHDMLRFEGGKWVRYGASTVSPQPEGIYEDRVTMLLDDGSVPLFGRYGGYITIGDAMRFFTDQATREAHPYLGETKRQSDIRKYLPTTRTDPDDWASVVSEADLARLRAAGYFLDLWHWRAGRSNPIDVSDDQVVAEGRFGDAGKGPYFTNWNSDLTEPRLMLDPARTGQRALRWEDLIEGRLDFEDVYYLREDQAIPFDATLDWAEGDVIPRRALRVGDGSRADIAVQGKARWVDGFWDVTLVRRLDTGHPLDDKILVDGGLYDVAVAVHRDATGSRWHYVSLPLSVGLGRAADVQAARVTGSEPDWNQPWSDMTLFYPGQVSWPMLIDPARHAGAAGIADRIPVSVTHDEEQLALYGVEIEFKVEIERQWFYTLFAGLALILTFGAAVVVLWNRPEAVR